ncbi:MAG: AraC family transcriptional regulator [Ruminococcaceae bacterium]|nr:AraC family transcriptional regulator [Oscillospiraceae bacterium]
MNPRATFFTVTCNSYFRYLHPHNFGHQQCKPRHTGGARVSANWILHYVHSGTGIFEVQGKIYHPKAGDMFIIRPDEYAFYAADEQDPWAYAWFVFETDIPLPKVLLAESLITDERLSEVFLSTYRQIKQLSSIQQDAALYGKLFELIGLVEKYYPQPEDADDNAVVHQVLMFMREHMDQPITVEDMARHVHLDYSSLVTLFRKVTGITPWRRLTLLRVGRAALQLMTQDYTIAQIAEQAGYKDAASFTRAFKRIHGISPTRYAETYRPYFLRDNDPDEP